MPKTSCKAEMKFIDVTALADATVSATQPQEVSNMELFGEEAETEQEKYGTLELNQFVLDGSRSVLPDTPEDIAYWSGAVSGNDCTFSVNPVFTAAFSGSHSSAGITLYFADDYPVEAVVTYYSPGGSKLISKTIYPDSLVYVCDCQIENYGKVTVEFIRTRLPGTYIKLQYVMYGKLLQWQDDLVYSASVHEELDETGATLPVNTAEVSIVDEHYDFDIGNEDGAWKAVQKTQEVTLTETKDGVEIPVGTFFIDGMQFGDNIATFSLISRIGLMDKYTFRDGTIYENETAGYILENIFSAAGVSKYSIENEVYDMALSGYLGIESCREALQMVCFACGAVADDSRGDTVRVYRPDRYVSGEIGIDRKFSGQTRIEQDEYVSGVSLECKKYTLQPESEEIYNDVLPEGKSVIEFSGPYLAESISVEGGTKVETHTNYVIVSMAAAGNCTITGRKYEESSFTYQKSVNRIAAGESENIISFAAVTLYNTELLPYKASDLLDHYSLRKILSMQYLIDTERVGDWVNVKDVRKNVATTFIESQDIDLTGGFISAATCRGYSTVVTDFYFTGAELYAGGNGVI